MILRHQRVLVYLAIPSQGRCFVVEPTAAMFVLERCIMQEGALPSTMHSLLFKHHTPASFRLLPVKG